MVAVRGGMRRACCAAFIGCVVACGSSSDARPGDVGIAGTVGRPVSGTGGTTASGDPSAFGNSMGGQGAPTGSGGEACAQPPCEVVQAPRVPDDDGFSVAEGDCDDFNAAINPGAYDVPGNGIDEDCQGGDATTASCDEALAIDSNDPLDAARAMELCPAADDGMRRWGVISARWTTPDGLGQPGNPLVHGILPRFGAAFAPRGGSSLLAISSGVARAPDQAGYLSGCNAGVPATSVGFPEGFDGQSPSCPPDTKPMTVVDAVALEVQLRVPTNASALSFDSAFFTGEYPVYICSQFNDFFQVIVTPKRNGGSASGNVVFDLDGNAVSVNNSLLGACMPGSYAGKTFACPLGYEPLKGTGYEHCDAPDIGVPGLFGGGGSSGEGASTGWLNTEMAVTAGETITMRIAIWDSGDSALDSLAVIDNTRFRLSADPPPPEVPVTMPVGPD